MEQIVPTHTRIIPTIASAIIMLSSTVSCHSSSTNQPADTDTPLAKRTDLMFKRQPELRANVKKEAVAQYRVRTENKLNELYFTVKLYETRETMKYLAKVDFEGLTGEDTVKLPDCGIPPHPVLQKAPEKYSCIIGLMDNNNTFRELKKVYVTDKGQELKITTLKHYMVTEGYRLVSQ